MEQNVANVEEVEQVVEEIVETTNPKMGLGGKLAIGGAIVGLAVAAGLGIKKLVDKVKSKNKKEEVAETTKEDWTEKLEEVANEPSIDDLAE